MRQAAVLERDGLDDRHGHGDGHLDGRSAEAIASRRSSPCAGASFACIDRADWRAPPTVARRLLRSPVRAPRGDRAGPELLPEDGVRRKHATGEPAYRCRRRARWRASRMSTPARSCSKCSLQASASKRTRSALAGLSPSSAAGTLVVQLECAFEVRHRLWSAVRAGGRPARTEARNAAGRSWAAYQWKASSPSSDDPGGGHPGAPAWRPPCGRVRGCVRRGAGRRRWPRAAVRAGSQHVLR